MNLNKEIAETIMGWEHSNKVYGRHPASYVYKKPDGGFIDEEAFNPQDDISDTKLVIERMQDKGYHMRVNIIPVQGFIVTAWYEDSVNTFDNFAFDESLERAICRAALRAIKEG